MVKKENERGERKGENEKTEKWPMTMRKKASSKKKTKK
jgi:hypothetical protein